MNNSDQHQSRECIHSYWRSPDQANAPETYTAGGIGRSLFLLDRVREIATPRAKILEIGCNAGRNLAFLYNSGYRKLTGVEISAAAISHLREIYPELSRVDIINAPIESAIGEIEDNRFELIFTVAVLEHLHWDSEGTFGEMARIGRRIITIEDERTVSSRHFRRNYKEVFEKRGLFQIESRSNLPGLPGSFVYRYFDRYKPTPAAGLPEGGPLDELFYLLGPPSRDLEEKLLAVLRQVSPDHSPEMIATRTGAPLHFVRVALRLFVAAGFCARLSSDERCESFSHGRGVPTKDLVKSFQRYITARWY